MNNASNETKKVQAALNMAHLNKHQPRFQTCPACRKPCPRCSVCMMNMGSNSGYFAGQSHMMPSGGKTGKKVTPFGSFFSWCQTCRHGGHCDHMEGTFYIQILIVIIAFCYQKFFWSFTVWIIVLVISNSRHSALNSKSFFFFTRTIFSHSWSEQFR